MNSREVWEAVSKQLTERKTISRASIIHFLDKLSILEVLGYHEEKSRGGHRKIYHPLMNEEDFVKHIVKTMTQSMMKDFPVETEKILNELYLNFKKRF